jgi:hypothetical protein
MVEIRDGGDVLDDVAAHHPVEQLFGLENAITRWLAEVDAPAELVPLLPELHRYCTRFVAELDRVRSRGRPRFERAQLADPNNPGGAYQAPWDEQARFRELVAALDRLARSAD